MTCWTKSAIASLIVFLASAAATWAQQQEIESCSDCHDKANGTQMAHPLSEAIEHSVHAGFDCTDCHEGVSLDEVDPTLENPHGGEIEPVHCSLCHDEAAEEYKMHGQLRIGVDPDLPSCWSCHGSHDIRPVDDSHSRVHPKNLANTCKVCHTDMNLVKRHEFLREAPILLYENSVHGRATKKGIWVSATCNDCHSAPDADGNQTAHRILSAGDPDSPIHYFNIPKTCGKCHERVAQDYWEGIHGKMVEHGRVEAPVCTNCHGEHGIISPDDPRSPVSAARLAEATCSPCHESVELNEKYGVPVGRLRSYVDSYHGLKAKAGEVEVANCASCHGAHRILPSTDPSSSIHPTNLAETCGECHPGISPELAKTSIHETATGIRTGWPEFFRQLYIWLIAITIGLMVLHNVADIFRHVKIMRRQPRVLRMTPSETYQHWLLTLSFSVLVISGFALRFSEAFWVQWLFGWGDGKGFEFRGLVHRIAAVVFLFCCAWHIFYLFSGRGRHALKDMLPRFKDARDIGQNSMFFLGRTPNRPRFGRFSYIEKAEYWALVWGGIIMSATGLLLWFDNYFVDELSLPKGVLDVMLVVHYYEAWLATLAILVWHGYSVVYSPHVYPMNPAWIDGRMPKDMYDHEHPEGPPLKARVFHPGQEQEIDELDDDGEPPQESH